MPYRSNTFISASNWNAWARATSSNGTLCLPPNTLAIIRSGAVSVVRRPLAHQPRLNKSPEEPCPRCGRLRRQGHQQFRDVVHGEIDALGEFYERHCVPFVGGLSSGLGHRRVDVCQQIGRHLSGLDGFRYAAQEPGLEELRRIGHALLSTQKGAINDQHRKSNLESA